MAWVKIPPEAPIFPRASEGSRIHTMKMFGGVAATVNGNMFAGLFGLSTIIWLPEDQRETALALKGASMFDPMGDGRKSDKVMLPVAMMMKPADLKKWIAKAFKAAAELPAKKKKPKKK
jgi:TfoX/Sxy family transcriptional regulator of competence genes